MLINNMRVEGTIFDAFNLNKEAAQKTIDSFRSEGDCGEFKKMLDSLMEGTPIDNLAEKEGIDEYKVKSWFSDMLPSLLAKKETVLNARKRRESRRSNGMDIYEYAKTHNADYYDQKTGYIFLVQNYRRALELGLPTPGIEVRDFEGNHVGYAQKCDDEE